MQTQLIADSGATKTAWVFLSPAGEKSFTTPGLSPYYLSGEEITQFLKEKVLPQLDAMPGAVHFYGTGCGSPETKSSMRSFFENAFPATTDIVVSSDLEAAAHALCGRQPGIACILGTGSNSCVYDGEKIIRNQPAPGFILGDEGSGAYLGKKVLQYFIYNTFDEELMHLFTTKYNVSYREIIHHVYKEPWPSRYLASFTPFLTENRGHYMIENIIEDGLSEFIIVHLYKYPETWSYPIHFSGGVAWHFKDVLYDLCHSFELEIGRILPSPMEGLLEYHRKTDES